MLFRSSARQTVFTGTGSSDIQHVSPLLKCLPQGSNEGFLGERLRELDSHAQGTQFLFLARLDATARHDDRDLGQQLLQILERDTRIGNQTHAETIVDAADRPGRVAHRFECIAQDEHLRVRDTLAKPAQAHFLAAIAAPALADAACHSEMAAVARITANDG